MKRTIRELLSSKPEYCDIIRKMVEYEESHTFQIEDDFEEGWTYADVGVQPTRLGYLVAKGVLKKVFDTNRTTEYRLVDLQVTYDILAERSTLTTPILEKGVPPAATDFLFEVITGYQDVKDLFHMMLASEKAVHIFLIGPPATAKSLFLLELGLLPGAFYAVGSRTSGAGLSEVLFAQQPRFLLIDELDKIDKDDLSVLLSLMEQGLVKSVKSGKHGEVQLNTRVIAAANRTTNVPPELMSRFVPLHFTPYTEDDFEDICISYLTKREDTPLPIAMEIADQTWNKLDRDIRTARSIARLAKTRADVAKVIRILKQYQKT